MSYFQKMILSLVFCVVFNAACFADRDDDQHFLVISDIHLNDTTPHAMDFSPRSQTISNDLDVTSFRELIAKIKDQVDTQNLAQPQYIVLLGDLVGHTRTTQQSAITSQRIVFQTIKEYFPNTPVLYTFGNNDSLISDYGPFQSHHQQDSVQSPFDIAQAVWPEHDFIATERTCDDNNDQYPCVLNVNHDHGYFSAYLKPHLKIISLNSVLFSSHQTQDQVAAPCYQQLQWLAQQLNHAHKQHDSVLLLSHIPPGKNIYTRFWNIDATEFWEASYLQFFLRLVKQYHTDIIGILAAHTHKDELKIIQDPQQKPLTGVYINASLSTSHGNAPSIRSYVLHHNQRWEMQNYSVYQFIHDTPSNITMNFLYDFKQHYCEDLNAPTNACLEHFSVKKMQQFYTAGNDHYQEPIQNPKNTLIG